MSNPNHKLVIIFNVYKFHPRDMKLYMILHEITMRVYKQGRGPVSYCTWVIHNFFSYDMPGKSPRDEN